MTTQDWANFVARHARHGNAYRQFEGLLREAWAFIGPLPYGALKLFVFPRLFEAVQTDETMLVHDDVSGLTDTELRCRDWSNYQDWPYEYCDICHFAIYHPRDRRVGYTGRYWGVGPAICHKECVIWASPFSDSEAPRLEVICKLAQWLYCPVPLVPPTLLTNQERFDNDNTLMLIEPRTP